ncbi:25137_t:CDS:1, partial [Gigaspora margarita]
KSNQETNVEAIISADLTELDRDLIKKFCSKIDKIKYMLCSICNECFLSIMLVKGECHHCYTEKNLPKKFSVENNMDSGEVPEELRDLIEIEEILIAQVFLVILVDRLYRGQLGYYGHVISFFQDVQEFTT